MSLPRHCFPADQLCLPHPHFKKMPMLLAVGMIGLTKHKNKGINEKKLGVVKTNPTLSLLPRPWRLIMLPESATAAHMTLQPDRQPRQQKF